MTPNQCGIDRPCYWELWLITLTGLLHVTIELMWGGSPTSASAAGAPERLYNLVAVILWGIYVLWRIANTPGMARAWGFRWDNFFEALRPSAFFLLVAAVLLLLYGKLNDRLTVPPSFWLALLLYPLYGIAQQFALQALVTRNLRSLISRRSIRACASAGMFSAAHFPNAWLMGLTFPTGFVFSWLYERRPNLWAVGITHGLLGALAYYLVLGLDPGAEIITAVRHIVSR